MAKPTTRTELKEYALRRLGDGAICVNITDAQAEDRIDDALCMYHDFHYDGMQRVLIAHPLTQTDIDNGYISVSDDVTGVVRVFPARHRPVLGTARGRPCRHHRPGRQHDTRQHQQAGEIRCPGLPGAICRCAGHTAARRALLARAGAVADRRQDLVGRRSLPAGRPQRPAADARPRGALQHHPGTAQQTLAVRP